MGGAVYNAVRRVSQHMAAFYRSIRIGSRLLFFDDEVETGALIGSHVCISYLRRSATEIKEIKSGRI